MKEVIYGIPVEYGDARFRLYDIRLGGGAGQTPQPHEHHYYELHFAHRGHHTYTVNGQSVTLRCGELLILPPEAFHQPVTLANVGDYRHTVFEFSLTQGTGRGGFYDYFCATLSRLSCRPVSVPSTLLQAVETFKKGVRTDEIGPTCYRQAEAAMLICELFSALDGFAPEGCRAVAEPDRSEDLILLENLVNLSGRSLREIAAAIHYSERHTARLIRRIYHMSLSEIRRKRCEEAAAVRDSEKNDT